MIEGVIYCYTSPTGKCYIGQTINRKLRKLEHLSLAARGRGFAFHRALRKYSIENFTYEELFFTKSKDYNTIKYLLDTMERYFIRRYKDNGITLYNLSEGGDKVYDWTGTHKSEEWKKRMSEIQKKIVFSPQRCRNISTGRKKPILQYSLEGEFIKEWESAKDVPFARQNAIVQCLKGRSKTCAGFQWRYKDEERNICSNSTNTT